MPTFRLLHASDLHVGLTPYTFGRLPPGKKTRKKRLISHDPAVVKAFVQWVWQNGWWGPAPPPPGQPGFDFLLLTGDMATTGDQGDLRAARQVVDADPILGTHLTPANPPAPTLAFVHPSTTHLRLLPGNHDRYDPWYRGYTPGATDFDIVFRTTAVQRGYWDIGQGWDRVGGRVRQGMALRVWAIDFTLRPWDYGKRNYLLPGWLGQGRVLADVLYGNPGGPGKPAPGSLVDEAQRWAKAMRAKELTPVAVWAIHFDPFGSNPLLELLDSGLLAEATREANVVAVLCGHTHETKVKPLTDKTVVLACGATTAAAEPCNDFQVIEIDPPSDPAVNPRPVFRVTVYRYDGPAGQVGAFHEVGRVTVP